MAVSFFQTCNSTCLGFNSEYLILGGPSLPWEHRVKSFKGLRGQRGAFLGGTMRQKKRQKEKKRHLSHLFTGSGTLGQMASPHHASVSGKTVPASMVAMRVFNMVICKKHPTHSRCSINDSFLILFSRDILCFYYSGLCHFCAPPIWASYFSIHWFTFKNSISLLQTENQQYLTNIYSSVQLICIECPTHPKSCHGFWGHRSTPLTPAFIQCALLWGRQTVNRQR